MANDERYGLIRLTLKKGTGTAGVEVTSTEPAVLDWIAEKAKSMFPKSQVFRPRDHPIIPRISVNKLDYCDSELAWSILADLCHEGWEPFSDFPAGTDMNNYWVCCLRKRL